LENDSEPGFFGSAMMNEFDIFNKSPYDFGIKYEMMWDEGSVRGWGFGFGFRNTVGRTDFR
jgi:hypothetical protein